MAFNHWHHLVDSDHGRGYGQDELQWDPETCKEELERSWDVGSQGKSGAGCRSTQAGSESKHPGESTGTGRSSSNWDFSRAIPQGYSRERCLCTPQSLETWCQNPGSCCMGSHVPQLLLLPWAKGARNTPRSSLGFYPLILIKHQAALSAQPSPEPHCLSPPIPHGGVPCTPEHSSVCTAGTRLLWGRSQERHLLSREWDAGGVGSPRRSQPSSGA